MQIKRMNFPALFPATFEFLFFSLAIQESFQSKQPEPEARRARISQMLDHVQAKQTQKHLPPATPSQNKQTENTL